MEPQGGKSSSITDKFHTFLNPFSPKIDWKDSPIEEKICKIASIIFGIITVGVIHVPHLLYQTFTTSNVDKKQLQAKLDNNTNEVKIIVTDASKSGTPIPKDKITDWRTNSANPNKDEGLEKNISLLLDLAKEQKYDDHAFLDFMKDVKIPWCGGLLDTKSSGEISDRNLRDVILAHRPKLIKEATLSFTKKAYADNIQKSMQTLKDSLSEEINTKGELSIIEDREKVIFKFEKITGNFIIQYTNPNVKIHCDADNNILIKGLDNKEQSLAGEEIKLETMKMAKDLLDEILKSTQKEMPGRSIEQRLSLFKECIKSGKFDLDDTSKLPKNLGLASRELDELFEEVPAQNINEGLKKLNENGNIGRIGHDFHKNALKAFHTLPFPEAYDNIKKYFNIMELPTTDKAIDGMELTPDVRKSVVASLNRYTDRWINGDKDYYNNLKPEVKKIENDMQTLKSNLLKQVDKESEISIKDAEGENVFIGKTIVTKDSEKDFYDMGGEVFYIRREKPEIMISLNKDGIRIDGRLMDANPVHFGAKPVNIDEKTMKAVQDLLNFALTNTSALPPLQVPPTAAKKPISAIKKDWETNSNNHTLSTEIRASLNSDILENLIKNANYDNEEFFQFMREVNISFTGGFLQTTLSGGSNLKELIMKTRDVTLKELEMKLKKPIIKKELTQEQTLNVLKSAMLGGKDITDAFELKQLGKSPIIFKDFFNDFGEQSFYNLNRNLKALIGNGNIVIKDLKPDDHKLFLEKFHKMQKMDPSRKMDAYKYIDEYFTFMNLPKTDEVIKDMGLSPEAQDSVRATFNRFAAPWVNKMESDAYREINHQALCIESEMQDLKRRFLPILDDLTMNEKVHTSEDGERYIYIQKKDEIFYISDSDSLSEAKISIGLSKDGVMVNGTLLEKETIRNMDAQRKEIIENALKLLNSALKFSETEKPQEVEMPNRRAWAYKDKLHEELRLQLNLNPEVEEVTVPLSGSNGELRLQMQRYKPNEIFIVESKSNRKIAMVDFNKSKGNNITVSEAEETVDVMEMGKKQPGLKVYDPKDRWNIIELAQTYL